MLTELNQIETLVYNGEKDFSASKIKYKDFRTAIKKYGYKENQINEGTLKRIQSAINLDYDKMIKDKKSEESLIY